MTSKTLAESFPDPTLEQFAESSPQIREQFEAFRAERERRVQVSNIFRRLSQREADEKVNLKLLSERLDFLKGADFAGSLLEATLANPGGLQVMTAVAGNFVNDDFIARHAPEIRRKGEARLKEAQVELAKFCRENASLLKELGLL